MSDEVHDGSKSGNPRLIAFYLPQFHPIKENDEWWGKGFTEWTNTARAKPRFPGHYQPHVPADLGFYDLRVPEVRAEQAKLAKAYGIEGFCYYHYWFGQGRRLLERPFNEVLKSGEPDFPFCLCWANDTWSGIWHGSPDRVLIKQEYPGPEDDQAHFDTLLPAFNDPRYMRVEGRPVFVVWLPTGFPDPQAMVTRWREMAARAGLPGLHLVGVHRANWRAPEDLGFDASIFNGVPKLRPWGTWANPFKKLLYVAFRYFDVPTILSYENEIVTFVPDELPETRYPSLVHAWDNTPRSKGRGVVLRGSTPALFRRALQKALRLTRGHNRHRDGRLVFLKSWNEWAEGNHLEPDLRDGHAYLQVIREEVEAERALIAKDSAT